MVIDVVKAEMLMPLMIENVEREARVMTDEHSGYRHAGKWFTAHGTTSPSKDEYVNLKDRTVHSNTIEDCFSNFKRGMKSVY